MKPWQKIDKKFVQEADHVEKAYNAVMVAKREDKAYSDDEWAKIEKQQTAILNGQWLDSWREYLQEQTVSKAEVALAFAEKLSQKQNEVGVQMYPTVSLNYRKDVLRDAINNS